MADTRVLARWLTFNAVGSAGMAVQMGCLWLLLHGAGLHYLPATLIAVEVAVLHNFAWHQRWTWRDRPAGTRRDVAARFARFQALNGAISLAVNAGAMVCLAGVAGLDPLAASVAAIGLASLANFAASDRAVFGRGAQAAAVVALVVALAPLGVSAQDRTAIEGWRRYEASVDARYRAAALEGRPFFVLDAIPGTAGWRDRTREGAPSLHPLESPDVDGGRIHHWTGAVFIPGMTVAQVIDHLQRNAGSEAALYEDVIESRLIARDGDRLNVFMKLRRTTVLTATFNTEHAVEYRRLGPRRASSRSVATRIAELADAGTPAERERPPSADRGFLWRLNAYWRFEQAGDGVLVECESVSLSRSVPTLLRPVAGPIISRVAREALDQTLRELAQGLIANRSSLYPSSLHR